MYPRFVYIMRVLCSIIVLSQLSQDIKAAPYFVSSLERQQYIETFKDIAISEMERTGIPASIKLAQGILESASGKSELARKANNHFGIKCGGSWQGKTYHIKDDDYDRNGRLRKSCFRVYTDAEESYIAHSDFLTDPRKEARYGFLFEYKVTEYKKWAHGLRKAGYATNPKYGNLLIKVIEDNNLHQYDYMSIAEIDPVFKPKKEKPAKKDKPKDIPKDKPKDTKPTPPVKTTTAQEIFYHNDVRTVFVKADDTPAKLAVKYRITLNKLLKYNDISSNTQLEPGSRFYLQPKRTSYRGKKKFHVVREGESMYMISRMYGVRLSSLYQRNSMNMGEQPAIGANVRLRGKSKEKPPLRSSINSKKSIVPPSDKSDTAIRDTEIPATKDDNPEPQKPETKPENTKNDNSQNPKASTLIHKVQKGDTLYGISRKYGVSVDEIKKINNLSTNTIHVGQEIIIKK